MRFLSHSLITPVAEPLQKKCELCALGNTTPKGRLQLMQFSDLQQ
jgi:hypothetical protein